MPYQYNYYGNQKYNERNTVHAMHVFHPGRDRFIRITFFYIQIFCYLPENTHKNYLRLVTINLTDGFAKVLNV